MRGLRRYLLATVSAAAFSTGALAADLPARVPVKAAPPVVAPWSWAGFYIGINAGVAWNHAKFADLGDDGGQQNRAPPGNFWKPHRAGFTGGGQIGYNFQSGNIVYGLEADFSGVSNKYSTVVNPPATFVAVNATTQLTWMATVRGRLGVTLSPTLLYVTGGLAVAHLKDSWGAIPPFATGPEYTSNKTRVGWTVGGGIEHMFARNWTAKIEALYADFGDWTVSGPPGIVGLYRSRFEHQVVTVRGGLNYKW